MSPDPAADWDRYADSLEERLVPQEHDEFVRFLPEDCDPSEASVGEWEVACTDCGGRGYGCDYCGERGVEYVHRTVEATLQELEWREREAQS